jgi:hypothetical protein
VDALVLLGDLERLLEGAVVEAEDDVGIHLDEAAIAVPGEARIAGDGGEARDGGIVEAEVEDGVHHPRHRHPGAGADRDEQRIGGVAEALAADALDMGKAFRHLGTEAFGKALPFGVVAGAHLGGDGEAGRHGQADRRHFGEVGALAAEEVPVARLAVGDAAAEAVDVAGHRPFPRPEVPKLAEQ